MNGPREYPRTFKAGEAQVTVRALAAADRDGILALSRALPEQDLLALRRDLADPEILGAWLQQVEQGELTALAAIIDDKLVGYASVRRSDYAWSHHVAEMRVVIALDVRGNGIGTQLTQEIFAHALAQGIEKLITRITPDQKAALAAFEGLGFRAEGVLRDHVQDRTGRKYDLLVLSHDVASFQRSLDMYGVTEALT